MFPVKDVTQLVGDAFCYPNLYVHVIMGMAKYPIVYSTFLDIVFKFHEKSSICFAVCELGALHPVRGYMVGNDNLLLGIAQTNRLFQE